LPKSERESFSTETAHNFCLGMKCHKEIEIGFWKDIPFALSFLFIEFPLRWKSSKLFGREHMDQK
jgi:hypothetical protein